MSPSRHPEMLGAGLFRAAGSVFLLRVAGAGAMLLASIVIARLTDPRSFGNYSVVLSAGGVLGMVAALGLPLLATREIATARAEGRSEEIRGLVLAALALATAGWILFAAPAMAIASMGLMFGEIPLAALAFGAVFSFFAGVNAVRAGVLRGMHAVVRADLPDTLIRPFTLLGASGCLYFLGWRLDESEAVALQCIAMFAAFLLGLAFLVLLTPPQGAGRRTAVAARDLGRKAAPFWGISVLSVVEVQVPLLLLGLLSEPTQAALYAAASQVIGVITLGLASVNAPLQGRLVDARARNDQSKCQRLVTNAAHLGFLIAAPVVLLLAIAPESVLTLFGPTYVEGASILRVLIIGAIINVTLGPCRIALNVCGQHSIVLLIVPITVVVMFILGIWLIPVSGGVGAAISATAGMVLWNLIFSYQCWRKLGLNTTVLNIP